MHHKGNEGNGKSHKKWLFLLLLIVAMGMMFGCKQCRDRFSAGEA